MKDQGSTTRRFLWNFVRAAVTLGAVAYVVSQITWQDRLALPDGKQAWGWTSKSGTGERVLHANDGMTYPVPADSKDLNVANALMPGFVTLIKGVNVWLLAASMLAFTVIIVGPARRWQLLLRTHDLDPGFLEALRLTWMGQLTNNVFPGSTGGDLFKGWCIYRRSPGKRVAAVMTVLMDRVVGLVSLMLVAAGAVLSQSSRPELAGPAKFVMWILFVVAIGGVVFFSGRIRRLLRVAEIVDRMPFADKIQELDQSMFHYRNHLLALTKCVGLSLLIHFWVITWTWVLGLSLGVNVSLGYYFVFLPVIFTAGSVAPSIAGLGVLEGLFQQFFSMAGVGATPSSAVALCILWRICQLIASLPGAVPTYQEFSTRGIPNLVKNGEPAAAPAEDPLTPFLNFKPSCR